MKNEQNHVLHKYTCKQKINRWLQAAITRINIYHVYISWNQCEIKPILLFNGWNTI